MLTTREQVKERILDVFDEIENATYAEDLINELADSECPVYYNQIIAEWTQLSPDDSNLFGEIMTPDQNTTIYDLMSVDLFIYYRKTFLSVYNDILDEQEEKVGA
jgi:hypothetical protein